MFERRRLEVWPGYSTSIIQFESATMLIADISHKVLSMATVYNLIEDLHRQLQRQNRLPEFRREVSNKVIGSIVITK